jgi:hypothetical protein
MKITPRSSLKQVAAAIADTLRKARIRAVLTGGACATIYSGGEYQSEDLDLILQFSPTQRALDEAMAKAGFIRRVDYYEHPDTQFFVEFPRGPLSIGSDTSVEPAELPVAGVRVVLLSATDSCRDRLAAFYHWKDRQSLQTAVAIAARHPVDLEGIRSWSVREGASRGFEEFMGDLRVARAARRRASHPRRPKRSR